MNGDDRSPGLVAGDLAAVHVAVFLFGLSGFLARTVSAPASAIVLGRALIAAAALWPIIFWLSRNRRSLSPFVQSLDFGDLGRTERKGTVPLAADGSPAGPAPFGARRTALFFLISGVTLAVHWLTFFHAIQILNVAVGLLSFATFPLFTTFLEPPICGSRLTARGFVTALAVAIAGAKGDATRS